MSLTVTLTHILNSTVSNVHDYSCRCTNILKVSQLQMKAKDLKFSQRSLHTTQ